jgi:hypothetical protein
MLRQWRRCVGTQISSKDPTHPLEQRQAQRLNLPRAGGSACLFLDDGFWKVRRRPLDY